MSFQILPILLTALVASYLLKMPPYIISFANLALVIVVADSYSSDSAKVALGLVGVFILNIILDELAKRCALRIFSSRPSSPLLSFSGIHTITSNPGDPAANQARAANPLRTRIRQLNEELDAMYSQNRNLFRERTHAQDEARLFERLSKKLEEQKTALLEEGRKLLQDKLLLGDQLRLTEKNAAEYQKELAQSRHEIHRLKASSAYKRVQGMEKLTKGVTQGRDNSLEELQLFKDENLSLWTAITGLSHDLKCYRMELNYMRMTYRGTYNGMRSYREMSEVLSRNISNKDVSIKQQGEKINAQKVTIKRQRTDIHRLSKAFASLISHALSKTQQSSLYQYQLVAPSHIPAGPVTASNHNTIVSSNAEPYQQAQHQLGVSPFIPAGPATASTHSTLVPSVAEQSPDNEKLPTPSPTLAGPATASTHSTLLPSVSEQSPDNEKLPTPSPTLAGPATASTHSTLVPSVAEQSPDNEKLPTPTPTLAGPATASTHSTLVPSVAEQSPDNEKLPTPTPTLAGPVTAGNHSPVVPTGGHQVEQTTQEATPQVAGPQTQPSGSQEATDTAEQQHTQEQGTLTQPAAVVPSAPSKKDNPQDDTSQRPEYRAIFTIPYDPAVFLPVLRPRAPIAPSLPASSAVTAHDDDDDDNNNISVVVKRRNFWGKVDQAGAEYRTCLLAELRRTKKVQEMARNCTCQKSSSKKSTSKKSAAEKSALRTLRSVPDLLDFPPPRLAGFLPGDQAAHSENIIQWITNLVRRMRATRPGNGPIGGPGGGAGGGGGNGGGHDDDDDDGDNGHDQGDGPGEADYDDGYGFCPPDLAVEQDDQDSGEAPESEAVDEEPAEAPVQDAIIVASSSSVPVAAARSNVRKRSRDGDSGDEADDEEPAKRHRGDGLSAPTEPEVPTTPAPSSSVQAAPDALSGLTSSLSSLQLKRARDSDEEEDGDVSKRRRTEEGDETHQRATGARQRPLAAISSRRNVGNSTTNPQVFNLGALSAALPSASATPAPRLSSPSSSTPPAPAPSADPTIPTVTTPPAQAGSPAQAQPPSSTRSQGPGTQADGSEIVESLGQMTLNDSAAPIPGDRQVAPGTFRLSVPRRTQPWTFGQESAAPRPAPAQDRVYTHEWVRVMLSTLPVDTLDTSEDFYPWVAPWVNDQEFLDESDTWVHDRWPAADHDTGVPITYGGLRQLLREWSKDVVGRWIRERVLITNVEGGWREAAQAIAWDLSARLGPYIERHPGKREDDVEYDENGREVKKSKRR
ncbi:hypothetical protein SLS53_007567 [Cytospora paraplurivora]|uniref:Uncharacterized protein n=1 Tax=Cytospora paraplurivora TaxID=2898453 RepID=A0AAN9YCE8_9PEZI